MTLKGSYWIYVLTISRIDDMPEILERYFELFLYSM